MYSVTPKFLNKGYRVRVSILMTQFSIFKKTSLSLKCNSFIKVFHHISKCTVVNVLSLVKGYVEKTETIHNCSFKDNEYSNKKFLKIRREYRLITQKLKSIKKSRP